MVLIALVDHRRLPVYGFARVADRLPPDRGPGLSAGRACSCPTAPRSDAPRRRSTRSTRDRPATPGVDKVITIAGVSALDNSAPLANAGVAYIILKDWERARQERGPAAALSRRSTRRMAPIEEARMLVLPPPPIQGIGNAARLHHADRAARRQLRPRQAAEHRRNAVVAARETPVAHPARDRAVPRRRAAIPRRGRPRESGDASGSPPIRCSSALAGYLGSAYVDQFNKFGRMFQVYVQADCAVPAAPEDIQKLTVRNKDGNMIPLGTLITITPMRRAVADQPLQSLSVGDARRRCRRPAFRPARRWR